MATTYRFAKVNAGTWLDNEILENVENAEITFDLDLDTKGTMTATLGEMIEESYVRVYVLQENSPPVPIGTFLVQTQSSNHDGRSKHYETEAYTPLHELNETYPDVGFYIPKGARITLTAADQARLHCRAPVIEDLSGGKSSDAFVADVDETWLEYLTRLLDMDDKFLLPDYDGSIVIAPKRTATAMRPVFEFRDDNSSITQADIEERWDLYKIPNRILVIADNGMTSIAENKDPDSQLSIENRGRVIEKRITDPALPEGFTQGQLNSYANRVLAEECLVEHTVQFTHGWIPNIHIGDCVRLNFDRADIHTRAIVQSMKITCDKTAQVVTTVKYTEAMT